MIVHHHYRLVIGVKDCKDSIFFLNNAPSIFANSGKT